MQQILGYFKALAFRLVCLISATLLAILIGVISQTHFILSRLSGLGVDISLSKRLSMTAYDIFYLGKPYGLFLFIAFGIAFLVAGLLFKFIKWGRTLIYTVAGGVAVFVLLFAIKSAFFNIHILAGARDFPGLMLQIIAGLLSGLLFAKISQKKTQK